ncbi:hypothetical protein M8C21_015224, partial [Ambrosia artemisiifolia]
FKVLHDPAASQLKLKAKFLSKASVEYETKVQNCTTGPGEWAKKALTQREKLKAEFLSKASVEDRMEIAGSGSWVTKCYVFPLGRFVEIYYKWEGRGLKTIYSSGVSSMYLRLDNRLALGQKD